jgi:hypothetical protein
MPTASHRSRSEDGNGALEGASSRRLLVLSHHPLPSSSPPLLSLLSLFLQEPFIQKNPEWVAELELMLRTGEKAEIQVSDSDSERGEALCSQTDLTAISSQALSSFGFQYITQEYLPRKLREGDWI